MTILIGSQKGCKLSANPEAKVNYSTLTAADAVILHYDRYPRRPVHELLRNAL